MRTSTPAAVLTVMVLLLAGCNKPAEPVRSWVGGDSQTEVMIKFTGPADSLQGTLDYTVVKPDDPQGAAGAQHLDFTGTIDGSLITLTFAEGFGFTNKISGTMDQSIMTLDFPDPTTGALATFNLVPGEVEEYQAGVTALKARAAQGTANQGQMQLRVASEAVNASIHVLDDTLAAGVDFTSFVNDLEAAKKDRAAALAAAKRAENKPPGDASACADAQQATYYANNVDYDAKAIEYDAKTVQTAIDGVEALLVKLAGDYHTVQALMKTQSQMVDVVGAAAVESIQSRATKAVASWQARAANYRTQAKKLASQAKSAATSARTAACGTSGG